MPDIQIELQASLASIPPTTLNFVWPSNSISAAELISRAIAEQCQQLVLLNQLKIEATLAIIARQYLSERDIQAMWQEGRIMRPTASDALSFETTSEIAVALEAFRKRRFLLLVGERQIEDEHEIISLNPQAAIRFIRLIPLQGG